VKKFSVHKTWYIIFYGKAVIRAPLNLSILIIGSFLVRNSHRHAFWKIEYTSMAQVPCNKLLANLACLSRSGEWKFCMDLTAIRPSRHNLGKYSSVQPLCLVTKRLLLELLVCTWPFDLSFVVVIFVWCSSGFHQVCLTVLRCQGPVSTSIEDQLKSLLVSASWNFFSSYYYEQLMHN